MNNLKKVETERPLFSPGAEAEFDAAGPKYKHVQLGFGVTVEIREDGVVLRSNLFRKGGIDDWQKIHCGNYAELRKGILIKQVFPDGVTFESSEIIKCVEFLCDDDRAAYQGPKP